MLWAIFRYSFFSPRITANAKDVLRTPSISDIEQSVDFPVPEGIINFYERASYLEEQEFYLSDMTREPDRILVIGEFLPLVEPHIRENQKIIGQKKLIIAFDMDKGFYFVDRDGSVRHWSPETGPDGTEVAASLAVFAGYEIVEDPYDE